MWPLPKRRFYHISPPSRMFRSILSIEDHSRRIPQPGDSLCLGVCRTSEPGIAGNKHRSANETWRQLRAAPARPGGGRRRPRGPHRPSLFLPPRIGPDPCTIPILRSRRNRFGVSPDQRFFFQTEQHREAVATLYYAVKQRRGFALLVGRPGLGKTSVLVKLIDMLRDEAETAYLPHPYFDRNTVLESILVSLGLETTGSPAQNHRLFYQYLLRAHNLGKTCVVIFDEAQNLTHETLEAIRMLSNFETPTAKLVQIVLSGQPGLAQVLTHPEMEQMRQRLNAIARLRPLDANETREYILHRNRVAGAASDLLSRRRWKGS